MVFDGSICLDRIGSTVTIHLGLRQAGRGGCKAIELISMAGRFYASPSH
jgi:hypothetical protein